MIINAQNWMPTFKCKKLLANYLMYEKNLSLLNVYKNYWYFNDDDLLQEILESLPWWLRLLKNF